MTDAQSPSGEGRASATFLTAAEIARIVGGRLVVDSPRPVRGAAVDSRLAEPGNLFVALLGERTDGHRFLAAAGAAGAAAVLVRELPVDVDLPADIGVVEVADPLAGLHAVAASWRRRFDPLVVGVTGSIAKTSTKDAIAAVLGERFVTLKNDGNQNNEVGLPITVLRLAAEHEAAVLEMGMYTGGEIEELAAIAQPRIGVVTAVHAVHLSRIGSLDAIERAKGELIEALPPNGTAVLNADDGRVRRMGTRGPAAVVTYGFAADADVRAEDVRSKGAAGMEFSLVAGRGAPEPMAVATLGRHAVHNALAAAAVGLAAGLSMVELRRGLARARVSEHRGELIVAGPIRLLDDTYNASPRSVRAALDLLATLPGRHVAVLGEMLELGDAGPAGHLEVGEAAAATADLLVVVGAGAHGIAEGARAAGLPADRTAMVPDCDAAAVLLADWLRPGDVVLLKASRGVAMERLVEELRAAWSRHGAGAGSGDRAASGLTTS
ncbi:MAG TPA: UDP-N-acetylmuramoyl-tripeptide--D-alanyl-D-alanine ligase [Candidatus Saccharimonadales bacterium]|nr:UDP-N-acetylmuramoyl-tripeptide--D-alanyl-D-alanine ligase [Candidatus Saccharimonadales bacterium]